jgi:hypothetical protein
MATFYDIYQSYLQNPYGGVNAVSGVSEVQGIGQPNQGIMNLIPQTSDGGDEGGFFNRDINTSTEPTTGPKAVGGGITQAFDQYQGLSNLGKLGVTSLANLAIPGAGMLLGLGGLGYDYFNPPSLSGYDQLNNPYGFDYSEGNENTFGGSTVGTAFGDVRGPDEDESPNSAAGGYGGGSEVGPGDDNDPGYDSGDYE